MHRRPISALVAAAVVASVFAGASAADAAPASTAPAPASAAAATIRAEASAALAGLPLPAGAHRMRAAAVSSASARSISVPLDTTTQVRVAAKRYDVHVVSTGSTSDRTRIRLFLAGRGLDLSLRRLVRVTVIRHGYRHPLLQTTTTFERFVVMLPQLQSNPLLGTSVHFRTRSAFVAALAHGLAIGDAEVRAEYGALLRFVQMGLDTTTTMLQAVDQVANDPTATDFSGVRPVQTTAGSGGYTGTVVISGTIVRRVPQRIAIAVTNTTDGSALAETIDARAITTTATFDGRTVTQTISLVD